MRILLWCLTSFNRSKAATALPAKFPDMARFASFGLFSFPAADGSGSGHAVQPQKHAAAERGAGLARHRQTVRYSPSASRSSAFTLFAS